METEKINEQPTEITLVYVQAVLMPNGEVITTGKTIGFFKDLKPYIFIPKQ